ncbi:MAG: DUF2333 family protein [Pseudomonadota bacterium]|nr:DUF2333 family protein [Pseudomonadota bacterium]
MRLKFWQDPIYMDDAEPSSMGTIGRVSIGLVSLYLLICVFLSWWWDSEPEQFPVRQNAAQMAELENAELVTGYVSTATFIRIGTTLLEKRGGYLFNDMFPPSVWMDNVPEWEMGTVMLLRDTARVYRNDFSRSQSQSVEDRDLQEAEGHLFFDASSWLLPRTESEYKRGLEYFDSYLTRLADSADTTAQFYARADNLQQWLATVETRLGSLSQRLSASVGKRQLNTDLAGDAAATQATQAPRDQIVKTPWLEIDNVFYQTRGYTWALLHMLRALEQDFGDVLDKKNARVSLQQIIRELEPSQDTLWSPIVLNGDGLGMLPNHSLVMASYIARANAAIIDLRTLLTQG